MRILEDRCRRNNIHDEGIPGSENERWDLTEEKLREVIKDELDIENVVIEQAHRVKRNNDNNENNNQTRKPSTVLAKFYYCLKTNRISCMKQNHVKLEIFITEKIFQEKL